MLGSGFKNQCIYVNIVYDVVYDMGNNMLTVLFASAYFILKYRAGLHKSI